MKITSLFKNAVNCFVCSLFYHFIVSFYGKIENPVFREIFIDTRKADGVCLYNIKSRFNKQHLWMKGGFFPVRNADWILRQRMGSAAINDYTGDFYGAEEASET